MLNNDDVTSLLDCTVCGCVMVDPRVLVCQHAFCLRCIFRLVGCDKGAVEIKCPFNCPQHTIIEDGKDVRSLPKNHLISHLCDAARRRQVAAGELSRCDFCDEPGKFRSDEQAAAASANSSSGEPSSSAEATLRSQTTAASSGPHSSPELRYCDRCMCVICSSCERFGFSDHSFLCPGSARHMPAGDGAAVGPAAAAGQPSSAGDAAASDRAYPFLKSFQAAMAHVKGTLQRERAVTELSFFTLQKVLVPFFESRAVCSGAHGSAVVEAEYEIFTVGDASPEGSAGGPRPTVMPRVESAVSNVAPFIDDGFIGATYALDMLIKTNEGLRDVLTMLQLVHRRARFARSTVDLTLVRLFVTGFEHAALIERVAIRPIAQRAVLCGNIEGCAVVDRLQRSIMVGNGVAKEKLRRRIEEHQQLSCAVNASVATALMELSASSVAATELVTRISRLLDAPGEPPKEGTTTSNNGRDADGKTSGAEPCASARSSTGTGSVSSSAGDGDGDDDGDSPAREKPSVLCADSPRLLLKLHAILAAFAENALELCALTERQTATYTSSSAATGATRRAIIEAETASTRDVRKLFGTLGTALETILIFVRLLAMQGPTAQLEAAQIPHFRPQEPVGLPDVVSELNPQISGIREQHLQIMRRHPNDTMQHRNLNGQLAQLQEQTIELFQKDHLLHLHNVIDTVEADVAGNVRRLLQVHRRMLGSKMGSPEGEVPALAAEAWRQERVEDGLRRLRRHRWSSRWSKKIFEADIAQLLVPIVRMLQRKVEANSPPESVAEQSPPPPLTAKYRLPMIDTDVHRQDGRFTEACQKRVRELAKKRLQLDDKTVGSISVTSSLRPGKRWLPFYVGHFRVPGDDRTYAFSYYAQTGECSVELPPRRGAALVEHILHQVLFTSRSFWAANGLAFAGLLLRDWVSGRAV